VLAVSFWQLGGLGIDVQFAGFVAPLVETGIGIGCSIVLLSTISLSSLRRADMTAGAGIYTLVRRVSGNVSYAVLATLVERRTIVHSGGMAGGILNQQARMSAYTDCYKLLAMLFVVALPLTLLLPKKGVPAEEAETIE